MVIEDLIARLQSASQFAPPSAPIVVRCPHCTHSSTIKDVYMTKVLFWPVDVEILLIQKHEHPIMYNNLPSTKNEHG